MSINTASTIAPALARTLRALLHPVNPTHTCDDQLLQAPPIGASYAKHTPWVDTTKALHRLPIWHPCFSSCNEAPEAPTPPAPPTDLACLHVSTWNILQKFSTDEPVIVPLKGRWDYKPQDPMGPVRELNQFPHVKIIELMQLMLDADYRGPGDMYYEDMVDLLNNLLNSQEGVDKATNLDGIAETVLVAFKKLYQLLARANATVYLDMRGVAGTSRLYPLTGSNKRHMFINGGDADPVMCGQQRSYTITKTNKRVHLNAMPNRSQASQRDVPLIKELSEKVGMDSAKIASYIVAVQHNNTVHVIGLDSIDLEKTLGMKAAYFSRDRNIIEDYNW